jgi:hypothetical protein
MLERAWHAARVPRGGLSGARWTHSIVAPGAMVGRKPAGLSGACCHADLLLRPATPQPRIAAKRHQLFLGGGQARSAVPDHEVTELPPAALATGRGGATMAPSFLESAAGLMVTRGPAASLCRPFPPGPAGLQRRWAPCQRPPLACCLSSLRCQGRPRLLLPTCRPDRPGYNGSGSAPAGLLPLGGRPRLLCAALPPGPARLQRRWAPCQRPASARYPSLIQGAGRVCFTSGAAFAAPPVGT